jgi:hypothetical protein
MTDSKRKTVINLKSSSKTNKHYSIVRIPAPEIVDEIFDVMINGTDYRVFVNRKLNRAICNEIVSYNYKGKVLLRNPVNKELSLEITKMLFDKGKPNEYRETINDAKREMEKLLRKDKRKGIAKKPGRKPEANLIRATLYCIKKYDNKAKKSYKFYIGKAYEFYKSEGQTYDTFVSRIYSKWAKLRKSYSKLEKQIRNSKTLYQHAKEELKIPRTNSKAKV